MSMQAHPQPMAPLTESQKSSIWYITPQDKDMYSKIMAKFDGNQSNSLTDKEMQQVMMQT